MSVIVSFVSIKGMASVDNPAISDCRVRETLALGSSTTASTEGDEIVLILNTEASAILVAIGSTPDAALAAKGISSSAGIPVGSGATLALNPVRGSKVNVKAVP